MFGETEEIFPIYFIRFPHFNSCERFDSRILVKEGHGQLLQFHEPG